MNKPLVVHCKQAPFDIYIGRPGPWGNPFSHKPNTLAQFQVATVEEAVLKHKAWVEAQPDLVAKIKRELRDKVLGCWCKTKNNPNALCHGDTLAEIANKNSR